MSIGDNEYVLKRGSTVVAKLNPGTHQILFKGSSNILSKKYNINMNENKGIRVTYTDGKVVVNE